MCLCFAFAPVLVFFVFGPVMGAGSGWKGLLRALAAQWVIIAAVGLVGWTTTSDLLKNWRDNEMELVMLGATAILPGLLGAIVVFAKHLEDQEQPVRICRACGYDLRASPDRCPECGLPIKRPGLPERL